MAFLLLALLMACCAVPRGLPAPDDLPRHTHGAVIHLRLDDGERVRGELIASDGAYVFVLPEGGGTPDAVQQIAWVGVDSYRLFYAGGKSLNWFVPVYTAMTLSHGWFLFLTAPVNLVATLLTHQFSRNEYTLREQDIRPEELSLFARFPQGLPPDLKLEDVW